MEESTEKPVDINSLSPERQKKVRKIRAGLREGTYVAITKVIADKTVGGVFAAIARS